jgi:hypothetical protein
MAVWVSGPDADQPGHRLYRSQEAWAAREIRAVVSHFQDVDRPQPPAPGEHRLDRGLGIPGQQRREAAIPQETDD